MFWFQNMPYPCKSINIRATIAKSLILLGPSLWNLALQKNFLYGRRQIHVVAVVLYIVCRFEKSPHLLIDLESNLKMGFSNLRDSGSVPWTILNFGGKSPAYYLLSKTNNK